MNKSILNLIKAEEEFLIANNWVKDGNLWTPKNKKHLYFNDKLSRSSAIDQVKDDIDFPQF